MAQFNTIEPISRVDWPGGSIAYTGNPPGVSYYSPSGTPAYPSGEVISYNPYTLSESTYDPTRSLGRSWKKIKDSGDISFTPYSRQRIVSEEFVVSVPFDLAAWKYHRTAGSDAVVYTFGPLEGHTLYKKNVAIATLSTSTPFYDSFGDLVSSHEEQTSDAIVSTQQAAFAEATATYDLLTELAEAGETLAFLQGLVSSAADGLSKLRDTDPHTFKQVRSTSPAKMLKSTNKLVRKMGSRWMAYRYAIMPLVYSFKDVNELLGKRDSVYNSGRSRELITDSVDISAYSVPVEGTMLAQCGSIESSVRSLYKTRYDRGALQRVVSQLAFNPFSTAWELIPMSFVIDWFVNINDAIIAATRIDSSTQSLGCTAVKRTMIAELYYFDTTVDRSSKTVPAWLSDPLHVWTYNFSRNIRSPLKRVSEVSYNRTVYYRPMPSLRFNPSLTWKRIIDGLVLTHQPLSKLLRSL